MTLIDAILKAKSHDDGKYSSPPPEIEESPVPVKKKRLYKYAHIVARVDSSSPRLDKHTKLRNLEIWRRHQAELFAENVYLLILIKRAHFLRGRVDSHWAVKQHRTLEKYQQRVDFLKRVHRDNQILYKRILSANARVVPTSSLNRDWSRNRRNIVERASAEFVLFPPIPQEVIEDKAFVAPPDVKRPRVYMKLGVKDGAVLGEICAELFMDMCPHTCRLFLDLLDGDTLGHGYVGTCFFRKVPHMYWSGGDVIYDNGFGCYAQRGRTVPIGAENYHFPHSMAGLLSMRVTVDDEMCGIFNITFKPLPQLDLRNVVFGRIIRPSSTYDIISELGNVLSSRPVVELRSSRRRVDGSWVYGAPNSRLAKRTSGWLRKTLMAV